MSKDECEKFYLENEKLAYKFGTKYGILHDEDMMQDIKIALYKAVKTFNPDKGVAFSTYAFTIMANEYNYHFRDKYLKFEFVKNTVIGDNNREVSIFEIVEDNNSSDLDTNLINQEIIEIVIKYIDSLDSISKNLYYDYYFKHLKQKEMVKKYNMSQTQISRKLKSINKCLQKLLIGFI